MEEPQGLLFRTVNFCYRGRRKVATGAACALALLIGWHAVLGANGLLAYQGKRKQAVALATQIQALEKENARLTEHNQRLQQNPDAIEGAIRSRLRYARPNEVIVTVDDSAK